MQNHDSLHPLLSAAQAAHEAGHYHEMVDGLGEATARLREQRGADWPEVVRALRATPAFAAAQHDPMTGHSFRRPRGYPGDALLLDYIYGDWSVLPAPDPQTPAGRLHPWTNAQGAPTAVRWRRKHLAQLMDEAAARTPKPRILSVAAGHLREAALSQALQRGDIGEIVALDQDAQSLAEVARQAQANGWPVTTMHTPIRNVIGGRSSRLLGQYDLAYAAGLWDYLDDAVARRLARVLFGLLKPGGRLMIANFTPATPNRGYMEAFMDWWLIYRTQEEVAALARDIEPAQVARSHSYLCPTGNIAYLTLRKAG